MATTALARADSLRKRLLLMIVALSSSPCVSLSVTIPLDLSSVRQEKKGVLPHPELRYVTAGIIDCRCEWRIHPTAHLLRTHQRTTSEYVAWPRPDSLGLQGSHKTCRRYYLFL